MEKRASHIFGRHTCKRAIDQDVFQFARPLGPAHPKKLQRLLDFFWSTTGKQRGIRRRPRDEVQAAGGAPEFFKIRLRASAQDRVRTFPLFTSFSRFRISLPHAASAPVSSRPSRLPISSDAKAARAPTGKSIASLTSLLMFVFTRRLYPISIGQSSFPILKEKKGSFPNIETLERSAR